MSESKTGNKTFQQLRLRYERTEAVYASQFVINATEEEIIINFSSGSLPETNSNETYLPIHTRVALSLGGARKLIQLLTQALSATTIAEEHRHKPPTLHS